VTILNVRMDLRSCWDVFAWKRAETLPDIAQFVLDAHLTQDHDVLGFLTDRQDQELWEEDSQR